jgi:2-keto-4-pentenoate hydratase
MSSPMRLHPTQYGAAIEAGQCIMTGSFNKPFPVAPGERWETRFSSVGTVLTAFD